MVVYMVQEVSDTVLTDLTQEVSDTGSTSLYYRRSLTQVRQTHNTSLLWHRFNQPLIQVVSDTGLTISAFKCLIWRGRFYSSLNPLQSLGPKTKQFLDPVSSLVHGTSSMFPCFDLVFMLYLLPTSLNSLHILVLTILRVLCSIQSLGMH